MSFFEAPPTPPEPPVRAEPEWLGPPENVLPHPFSLWLTLARTDRVAVQLHSGRAYLNGFQFDLTLRRREERRGIEGDPIHSWHSVRQTGVIPDEALRLGIEFADGQKATVFDGHRYFRSEERPSGPVLIQRGGTGAMRTWELSFWVWPLPPPGVFTFVGEWPSEQVALTRLEIDAQVILDAAAQAQELWPEGGIHGRGYAITQRIG